jgi:mRNA-degrading endonuclease RelE of RelBE toxin-antitoxin system
LAYLILYSPDSEQHLRLLTSRQRVIVLNNVDKQLKHNPTLVTRNRKPMRPNPLAPWELRIGDLRVYYDVDEEPERIVKVLAVGVKKRNMVRIGKEVIEL